MLSRNAAKAQAPPAQLGSGATAGKYGAAPAGDIVVLAIPYTGAADAVADLGKALAGKVIIDVTNAVTPDLSGLVPPHGGSGAQETAKGLPAGANVVKAFNTTFRHVLAKGGRLDPFIAGHDAQAKALVSAFLESLGLRPPMLATCRWRKRSKHSVS